ncbi:hypothetical protein DFH11DRAFT_1634668 [Phellopilus nigrolimitatus]|nr:hypothetical protein DFH11DRAFT_1634668 [Phellopilus nigrolimitatus]
MGMLSLSTVSPLCLQIFTLSSLIYVELSDSHCTSVVVIPLSALWEAASIPGLSVSLDLSPAVRLPVDASSPESIQMSVCTDGHFQGSGDTGLMLLEVVKDESKSSGYAYNGWRYRIVPDALESRPPSQVELEKFSHGNLHVPRGSVNLSLSQLTQNGRAIICCSGNAGYREFFMFSLTGRHDWLWERPRCDTLVVPFADMLEHGTEAVKRVAIDPRSASVMWSAYTSTDVWIAFYD